MARADRIRRFGGRALVSWKRDPFQKSRGSAFRHKGARGCPVFGGGGRILMFEGRRSRAVEAALCAQGTVVSGVTARERRPSNMSILPPPPKTGHPLAPRHDTEDRTSDTNHDSRGLALLPFAQRTAPREGTSRSSARGPTRHHTRRERRDDGSRQERDDEGPSGAALRARLRARGRPRRGRLRPHVRSRGRAQPQVPREP